MRKVDTVDSKQQGMDSNQIFWSRELLTTPEQIFWSTEHPLHQNRYSGQQNTHFTRTDILVHRAAHYTRTDILVHRASHYTRTDILACRTTPYPRTDILVQRTTHYTRTDILVYRTSPNTPVQIFCSTELPTTPEQMFWSTEHPLHQNRYSGPQNFTHFIGTHLLVYRTTPTTPEHIQYSYLQHRTRFTLTIILVTELHLIYQKNVVVHRTMLNITKQIFWSTELHSPSIPEQIFCSA